jgi:uncharacterized protein (DUF1501 family)
MLLDRRHFVWSAAGSLALLARPARALARGGDGAPGTLVLLQLSGGNDGLSTLIPYADDGYARARRSIRMEADRVRRLDDRVGLHPALASLEALHGRGQLALVEGVGYPQPNRSHFRSMDVWHAADARGRACREGWVGRAVALLSDAGPLTAVHLGLRAPFSLHSAAQPPACVSAALLRAADPAAAGAGAPVPAPEPARSAGDELDYVRRIADRAQVAMARVHAALDRAHTDVRYPGTPFAQDLRTAAALIHAGIGVRVLSLELGGFDTHDDQRGRHDRLMAELDGGLGAFAEDLGRSETGRATTLLAFSEFGRRVAENGSGGTDHGAAGLAFVLGPLVRGGLFGKPPALEELADGDLVHTTDFRSLYATVIEHVFGLEHERVLGAKFPRIECV